MHLSTLETKSKVGTIVGGVISGVLGLLLILVAVFCFLRKRRRARSDSDHVPYSPVEPRESPDTVDTEEVRQLPPIRTITPLAWPVNTSRTPTPHADTTDDDIGDARQLPAVGGSNNPFRTPSNGSSSTKLVDAPSVRLSRSLHSDESNLLGVHNNQYWSRASSGSSLDAAYPESEMLGHDRTSSTTTAEMVPTDNLSAISHCPYPVLEPDAEKLPRHLSVKSELSYATLTPEQMKRMENRLSRTSSSSSARVVNVSKSHILSITQTDTNPGRWVTLSERSYTVLYSLDSGFE